jgi:hypothetical protein
VNRAEKNDHIAHNACFPLPIKALGMVILLFQDCPCHDYAMTIPSIHFPARSLAPPGRTNRPALFFQ